MGSTGKTVSSPVKMSITMPSGTVIELDEELEYGQDSGRYALPRTVVDFERKRKSAKIEYAMLTDAIGNVLEERRGGKGSVKTSYMANRNAALMSHIHPRSGTNEDGTLGGTFSVEDFNAFMKFPNQRTMRAVAGEGTYSFSKGTMSSPYSFVSAYNDYIRQIKRDRGNAENTNYLAYKKISDDAYNDYRNNRITYTQMNDISKKAYDEYQKKSKNLFNKELISMHKWLIANQAKYGYTYALER